MGHRSTAGARISAVALLLLIGACEQSLPTPSTPTPALATAPSPTTHQVERAQSVLDVAFASPVVAGEYTLAPFPRSVASQGCQIPTRSGPISGTCRTEVEVSGIDFLVKFTQAWDASLWRAHGDPPVGELRATWAYRVSPGGAVTPLPMSGNFPPQLAK
jgi:hypothetical protein